MVTISPPCLSMPVYTLSIPSPAYAYDETFPTRCTESFSRDLHSQLSSLPVTVYAPTSEELDEFWNGLIESYNNLSEYVNQWLVYLVDGAPVPTASLPGISCGSAVKGYPGIMGVVSDFLRLRFDAAIISARYNADASLQGGDMSDALNEIVDLLDQIKDQETILNIGDFLVWTKSACVDEEIL